MPRPYEVSRGGGLFVSLESRTGQLRELSSKRISLKERMQPVSNLVSEINELHAHMCQALADPKRILILYTLNDRPCNVTEISEALDIPQPTVSRHLKMLRERGLVTSERRGNIVVYALSDPRVVEALDIMRAVLADTLSRNAQLAEKMDR